MRIIDITHPPQSLWIGREGENTFRPVSFECANWFSSYPNATIAAYYQPYGSSDPYPLVLTVDGTKRIWHPLLAELVKGDGELQIVLMNGDTVGTSAIIPTKVDRSLISNVDHPASESPSWAVQVVQDVAADADRAEAAVEHYPKIVNGVWHVWSVDAEDFVSTGIEAQGEEGYSPTVTITAIDGGHRVTITDADGAHTFDVMDGEGSQGGAVESVNGKTGVVVLDAEDVGALPESYTPPVSSVNGKTGAVVLGAADVHALPDSTVIPPTVTEQTVAGWGFTKNTGTYSKPSGGIPKTDLASAVQTSLGKADTAVQPSAISDMATETWVENKGYQTAPFEIPISDDGQGNYTTTAMAQEIYDNAENCEFVVGGNKYRPTVFEKTDEHEVMITFSLTSVDNGTQASAAVAVKANTLSGTVQIAVIISTNPVLPPVTASDNGKFLRVVSGAWAAQTVPSAESNSFGGGS